MLLHNNSRYSIYFGDSKDDLVLNDKTREIIRNNAFALPFFQKLQKMMSLSDIVFLHQTHSSHGLIIRHTFSLPNKNFSFQGDYIITDLLHTGIGVLTADCLPIVCYDTINHCAAVIHAGWKGLVAGIIPAVITQLQTHCGTNLDRLIFFFGPSAKQCCYRVQDDFIASLDHYTFSHKALYRTDGGLFFNLPLFAQLQLKELGALAQAIHTTYNHCTICNVRFFSYRRQQQNAGRQVTLITLR